MIDHRARHTSVFVCAIILACSLAVVFTSVSALRAQQPFPKEHFQDFRGSKPLIAELKMVGPDADTAVMPEDAGLRITLPKTRKSSQPVGVRLQFPLAGDFEITGTYEVLSLDRPPINRTGVGVAFNLATANDHKRFAKLGRFMSPKHGDVYIAEAWDRFENGNPDINKYLTEATTALTGQLRLVREGSKLRYLVADPPGAPFRELYAGKFTAEDLEIARFAANNNGSPAGIDVLLLDFRIRHGDRPAPAPVAPGAQEAAPPSARGWLAAVSLGGVAILLILALIIGLVIFLRRRADASATPDEENTAELDPASSSLSFLCFFCGKRLKVKAELEGKKVKCTHCGKTVPVA